MDLEARLHGAAPTEHPEALRRAPAVAAARLHPQSLGEDRRARVAALSLLPLAMLMLRRHR